MGTTVASRGPANSREPCGPTVITAPNLLEDLFAEYRHVIRCCEAESSAPALGAQNHDSDVTADQHRFARLALENEHQTLRSV